MTTRVSKRRIFLFPETDLLSRVAALKGDNRKSSGEHAGKG